LRRARSTATAQHCEKQCASDEDVGALKHEKYQRNKSRSAQAFDPD
jgi:hypothetical protein